MKIYPIDDEGEDSHASLLYPFIKASDRILPPDEETKRT